jgi:hypothetical protein
MKIARGAADKKFIIDTLEQFEDLCEASYMLDFDLTEDDLMNLATSGDINKLIHSLRKLIKLLPITPIDTEELREIFKHAREVLLAA